MRALLGILFAMVMVADQASASDKTDVMSRIQQTVDAYQKNDIAAVAAIFAPSPTIMDDMAPYYWQGASAVSDFAKDDKADFQKNSITEASLKLHKPDRVDVSGNAAYVILPAVYSYKQQGKKRRDNGIVTVSLQKIDNNWRIAAWVWTRQ